MRLYLCWLLWESASELSDTESYKNQPIFYLADTDVNGTRVKADNSGYRTYVFIHFI